MKFKVPFSNVATPVGIAPAVIATKADMPTAIAPSGFHGMLPSAFVDNRSQTASVIITKTAVKLVAIAKAVKIDTAAKLASVSLLRDRSRNPIWATIITIKTAYIRASRAYLIAARLTAKITALTAAGKSTEAASPISATGFLALSPRRKISR